MKKIVAITIAFIFTVISIGCKPSGKYADLKGYMNDVTKIQEDYISALDKSNTAKEVAEAITDCGNKMEKLSKKSEELLKKYPDFKEMGKNPPKELKEEFEKRDQMMQKLLTVSMKTMKYMMDPEVMKASQESTKKMGKGMMIR
jgi:hypothetical protein